VSVHPNRKNGASRALEDGVAADGGTGPGAPLDGDAVERLVLAHQGALRGFLRYLGCPASLVDDLVQETFLTFLSARFEHRDDRATARYLRTIGRHLFLKSLRRLDRDPPALDLDEAEAVWAEFQDDGGGAPYLDALRSCLGGVTGRAKDALEMRYAGNLGRAAIAEKLELTESGVHSILVRVRRKLRECVERRLGA
jgi:RNA polymerase sigma-70 factor (ECF subfamily)